jgi:dTDP-4-dehydrorhamnose reductase
MLATDVAQYLAGRNGYRVIALSRAELDVTRQQEVAAAVEAHRPYAVIHTAALHVDDCEADPRRAFGINAWATGNLARACEARGAVLVYISTGGVFGDEVRAYHEYDRVVLKTVYARSKYAGEEYVRQFCRRHFILRPGWLYGGGVLHRKNFVVARYREAARKPLMQSAGDKYGSPTYTGDAARVLLSLLESGAYGLYHVANEGGCSRVEYVRAILQAFDLANPVEAVPSSHFPRKAQVPDCEMLTSFNLGYAGLPALPPWEEALPRYVHSIRDEIDCE